MDMAHEPTLAETAEKLDRFADRLEKASHPMNTNNVTTTFNAGGIGVLVGIAGVFLGLTGMYVINDRAESRMVVMAEARRADMAALTALQSQVNDHTDDLKGVRAWLKINGESLAKLEAKNAD